MPACESCHEHEKDSWIFGSEKLSNSWIFEFEFAAEKLSNLTV